VTRLRVWARLGAVLASAALLVPTLPGGAAAAAARAGDTVVMTVDSVSPSTPVPSRTPRPLTVQLSLTNTTDAPLDGVRIVAERGDPIGNQDALDAALRKIAPPTTAGVPIPPTHKSTIDLPPGKTEATFSTTTSILNDGTSGLCLCHRHAVYPLFFSAHVTGTDGVDQRLGVTGSYLPSFYARPAPLQVNWIWPLIERPHRLFGSAVFTDDFLAQDVVGGRLDRALQVLEGVGDQVPMTLVVDPELLDELEVMATGKYVVQSGSHTVPGRGQQPALAWLDRLHAVLSADPDLQVELTPYADPDIESLTQNGLGWTTALPADMAARVSQALPGLSLDSTVAWPASGAISARTLQTLVSGGVSTVVLNSGAVTPRTAAGAVPAGLARLESGGSDLAVALTAPAVQQDVAKVVTRGGAGAGALPRLVAELAVRSAQQAGVEHVAVLTPPRYVDPTVASAVQAIKDTSTSMFSRPISLRSAVSGDLLPTGRSGLARLPASAATLPSSTLDTATHVTDAIPAISALLEPQQGQTDPAALKVVTELPVAVQRAESSAWREKSDAAAASRYADQLENNLDGITSGVHIVRPSSGAYTLASSSSPLPITVSNEHPYPVTVQLKVSTAVNGLPGFTTRDIGVQRVDGDQKRTLNVPTQTERSGRIRVEAVLLTPNNFPLGDPVQLTIRSTALGAIGVVITVVAGVVLALALLVRLGRRLRKRRSGSASTGTASTGTGSRSTGPSNATPPAATA
jgi:uncharacterized protein DUF6049